MNAPSLYIFTSQHYSIMWIRGPLPRPGFAALVATEAEKLEAFDSFNAHSGTYEISGSTLITKPIIAKHPHFTDGGEDRLQFRTAGDTLWLTANSAAWRIVHGGQLVAPFADNPYEVTFKLVRVPE